MKKLTWLFQMVMVVGLIGSCFCGCQNPFRQKLVINIQPINHNVDNIEQAIDQFDQYLKDIGMNNYEIRLCSITKAPNNAYINYSYEDMDWWRFRADSLIKHLIQKTKMSLLLE